MRRSKIEWLCISSTAYHSHIITDSVTGNILFFFFFFIFLFLFFSHIFFSSCCWSGWGLLCRWDVCSLWAWTVLFAHEGSPYSVCALLTRICSSWTFCSVRGTSRPTQRHPIVTHCFNLALIRTEWCRWSHLNFFPCSCWWLLDLLLFPLRSNLPLSFCSSAFLSFFRAMSSLLSPSPSCSFVSVSLLFFRFFLLFSLLVLLPQLFPSLFPFSASFLSAPSLSAFYLSFSARRARILQFTNNRASVWPEADWNQINYSTHCLTVIF